jgi:hypothetical protein
MRQVRARPASQLGHGCTFHFVSRLTALYPVASRLASRPSRGGSPLIRTASIGRFAPVSYSLRPRRGGWSRVKKWMRGCIGAWNSVAALTLSDTSSLPNHGSVMRRDKARGVRSQLPADELRYWGCGLGFAVLFITLIDLMHRNLAPTFATRIPRVRRSASTSSTLLPNVDRVSARGSSPLLISLLSPLSQLCLFSLFSVPLDPFPSPLRPLSVPSPPFSGPSPFRLPFLSVHSSLPSTSH